MLVVLKREEITTTVLAVVKLNAAENNVVGYTADRQDLQWCSRESPSSWSAVGLYCKFNRCAV